MAMLPGIVYELDTNGDSSLNGGGFAWYNLSDDNGLMWVESGTVPGEWYCVLKAGTDPSIPDPACLQLDGNYNLATKGTVGALTTGQWGFGDNDSKGFSVIYIKPLIDDDPDNLEQNTVSIGVNGGFDYSQQATAAFTSANISTDVTGTQITDDAAGGNVTAIMVDNVTYIPASTGFTAGYYLVTNIVGVNTFDIDRSCGASASNGSCKIGGSIPVFKDAFFDQLLASVAISSTVYVNGITFALTESIIPSVSGKSACNIEIIGYKTTRGDAPVGTDMPYISSGAYLFSLPSYWSVKHIRGTGTGTAVFRNTLSSSQGIYYENVRAVNTSISSARYAFLHSAQIGNQSECLNCYGESTLGTAFNTAGMHLYRCVSKDSDIGFSGTYSVLWDKCISYGHTTYGIQYGNYRCNTIACTIDDCTDSGIYLINTYSGMITDTTITNCGIGIKGLISNSNYSKKLVFSTNNIFGCTKSYEYVKPSITDTSNDPEFADRLNGNFAPTVGNIQVTTDFVGELTTDKYNIGAVGTEGSGGATGRVTINT